MTLGSTRDPRESTRVGPEVTRQTFERLAPEGLGALRKQAASAKEAVRELRQRFSRATELAERIESLRRTRDAHPVKREALIALEEADRAKERVQARREAAATRVEIAAASGVEVRRDGAPIAMEAGAASQATLTITPSGASLIALDEAAAETEQALDAQLRALGQPTVEAAQESYRQRQDADAALQATQDDLTAVAPAGCEALASEGTAAEEAVRGADEALDRAETLQTKLSEREQRDVADLMTDEALERLEARLEALARARSEEAARAAEVSFEAEGGAARQPAPRGDADRRDAGFNPVEAHAGPWWR